ncbi:MAG: hypothetical protein IIZ17_00830 [Eubacteriaceae bacterium]|nr:hypothetical protein [Eubacteriaceae bacterium]MBQ1465212.1 hypothetical protein [Eubacteriaceae bacterium]MCR4893218.1 hypothetical protein [Eubacteriales bacterium]
MDIEWIEGSEIRADIYGSEVVITANREGLISLAKHLVDLAEASPGSHIHYDEFNSLEEGSVQLIIGRSASSSDPEEETDR